MPDPSARDDRLRAALKLLADEVRERIDHHPLGHLIAGRGEPLDLNLALPTALRDGSLERSARDASEAIQEALQTLLAHSAIHQPGRVYCLRCDTAGCVHAVPADGRQVFTGYGPTGLPRYRDFGQWLLERHDPRIDLLYREPPQLVALASPGEELTGNLIPLFGQPGRPGGSGVGYRLHGQVAVGWYHDRGLGGLPRAFAVSFQILSSRPRDGRRRFGLNVIGTGPGGEPLENLFDRVGEIPWADPVRWAQTALDGIEHAVHRRRASAEVIEPRLAGILAGLARRLEKGFRGKERRTRHAERRHHEGDRPTRMALADLARAAREDLLFDTRSEALVVVGDRGRAHVFSRDGKLVTSVRYNPASIEKRRQSGLWRPAAEEEVSRLKRRLEAREA
ncbi:MAG TPA: hypothetical protein VFE33_19275 [Thermoanaerobaculia bacterium]|nr:hypothetical protein [Thermoanaerobaculia bacterium]